MRGTSAVFLVPLLIFSCSEEDTPELLPPAGNETSNECTIGENGWTIPLATVADGGVGKDGIASIDDPQFISVNEVDFLTNRELVIALKVDDDIRVYPQRILDQHEIVNDVVGGVSVAVTLCPLTGTAIAFDRSIDGTVTTLGVSGLLYNNNLVVYDRASDTRWSQMTFQAIQGLRACDQLQVLPVVELSWSALRALHPEAKVLSKKTGFDKRYANEPLTTRTPLNSTPAFPYQPIDNRLPNFLRVHMVRDSLTSIIYPIDAFDNGLETVVDNNNMLLVVNPEAGMIVSFELPTTNFNFEPVSDTPGVVMADSDGNRYNVFGEVVAGPNEGQQLKSTTSYMGYWFAIGAMFPNPTIFSSDTDG